MLESKVQLDHKDLPDLLAQLVCLVSRVSLVTMGVLVTPDLLVNPEPQVLKDRKVNKVAKDLSVPLDSLGHKVHLATEVYLVFQDLSVLLVLVVYADQLVKLDLQADPVMKVPLVPLVLSDPLARSVHLVNLDLKARPVKKVPLVLAVVPETKARLVLLALSVHLDHLVFLDPLDNLDPLVLLVNAVPSVKLVRWELKVPPDLVVNQALLVSKANAEREENPELKALKVIAVSSVFKVFLAPSVPKETEDQWVLPDLQVNLVNPDLKVLPVVTEALDLRVSWAHLVPVVPLVSLANPVLLVLLVQLVLQVLLVNRWATTLLPWLLFSDKVNLRDRIRWLAMTHLVCSPN